MRRLIAFLRDRTGIAAVEFALIAPMMVVLMFGSIELVNALQTSRRVQNTASSLADVVSRDTEISNAERDGLWDATGPLLFPDETTGLAVRITSIRIESSSNARVEWSEQLGDFYPPLARNTQVSGLAAGMMVPSTNIIRVETRYNYTPVIGFWMLGSDGRAARDTGPATLTHVAYSRSRLVDLIARVP